MPIHANICLIQVPYNSETLLFDISLAYICYQKYRQRAFIFGVAIWKLCNLQYFPGKGEKSEIFGRYHQHIWYRWNQLEILSLMDTKLFPYIAFFNHNFLISVYVGDLTHGNGTSVKWGGAKRANGISLGSLYPKERFKTPFDVLRYVGPLLSSSHSAKNTQNQFGDNIEISQSCKFFRAIFQEERV